MPLFPGASTDPVEELRLRRWARENYVPVVARDEDWHAVVLDEMRRKDEEQSEVDDYAAIAQRIVPSFSGSRCASRSRPIAEED